VLLVLLLLLLDLSTLGAFAGAASRFAGAGFGVLPALLLGGLGSALPRLGAISAGTQSTTMVRGLLAHVHAGICCVTSQRP
jgi:hypothetical protein